MNRLTLTAGLIGALVGMISSILALTPIGLAVEEDLGLHWLFRLRGPIDPPSSVVIIDTSEISFDQLRTRSALLESYCSSPLHRNFKGRPPRCILAGLVESLDRIGVSVIAFDIFFGEPSIADDDELLANAIAQSDRVVLLQSLSVEQIGGGKTLRERVLSPIDTFSNEAAGLAPFPLPKFPAKVSQFWAFKGSLGDQATLPSVALQIHGLTLLNPLFDRIRQDSAGEDAQQLLTPWKNRELAESLRHLRRKLKANPELAERLVNEAYQGGIPDLTANKIPLWSALLRLYAGDESHYFNFYGPPGTIRTIPILSILNDAASVQSTVSNDIKDKAVFIGPVKFPMTKRVDGFFTVYSREDGTDLSGVEIAATAFANLLSNRTLKQPNALAIGCVLIVTCIAVGLGTYRTSGIGFIASTAGIIFAYLSLAAYLFVTWDLWMPVVLPPASHLTTIAVCLAFRIGVIAWPTRVVYGLCLVTDIQGFTSTAETYRTKPSGAFGHLMLRAGLRKSPLATALGGYFDVLGRIVERNQGKVLHQHGDSMMCVWQIKDITSDGTWGRLAKKERGAREHACKAALEIHEEINLLKNQEQIIDLPTRIGIDIGHFDIGHLERTAQPTLDVIGDPANTASRLESLNRQLGTKILVSKEVTNGLSEAFALRRVGTFVLKGKNTPTRVVEIQSAQAVETEELCRRFKSALLTYVTAARRSQRLGIEAKRGLWKRVAQEFKRLLATYPKDGPTLFFLARAQAYTQEPPLDRAWPIVMKTK